MSLRNEVLGLLATLGRPAAPAAPASPFFLRTRRPSAARPYSAAAAVQVRQSEPIDDARVAFRPESAAAARDPSSDAGHARAQSASLEEETKRRAAAERDDRRQLKGHRSKPKASASGRPIAQTTPSATSRQSTRAGKKRGSPMMPVHRDDLPHAARWRRPAETTAGGVSSTFRSPNPASDSRSTTPASSHQQRPPGRTAALRTHERKLTASLATSRTAVKPLSPSPAASSSPPPPPFSIMPPTLPPTAANLNAVVSGFQRVLDSYISFLSSFPAAPGEPSVAAPSSAPSLKETLEASAFQSRRRQASEMLTITGQALQGLFPAPSVKPASMRPSASAQGPIPHTSSRRAAPEATPAAKRSSLGSTSGGVASSELLAKQRTGSVKPGPPPPDAKSIPEHQRRGEGAVGPICGGDNPPRATSLACPPPPTPTAPRALTAPIHLFGAAQSAPPFAVLASSPAASCSSQRPLMVVPEGTRGRGARKSGGGGAKTNGATSISASPVSRVDGLTMRLPKKEKVGGAGALSNSAATRDVQPATPSTSNNPRRESTPAVPPPAVSATALAADPPPAHVSEAGSPTVDPVWDGKRFVQALEAASSVDQVKAIVDDLAARSEQVDAIAAPEFWTHLISKCRELSALPVAAITLLRSDRLHVARPTASHMSYLRDGLHDMLLRHAPRSDASPLTDRPPLPPLDIRVLRMFLNALPEDPVICALVLQGLHRLGDDGQHDLRQLEEVILRRSATTPWTKFGRKSRHSEWTMEALDSIRPFVLPSVLNCWTPDTFELPVNFHRDRMIALARHLATRSSARSGMSNALPLSDGDIAKSHSLPDMPAAFLLVNAYVEATLEAAEARADPIVNLCAVFAWSLSAPDESATFCLQQHMPIMLAVSRGWLDHVKRDPAKRQLTGAHRAALRALLRNLNSRHLIQRDTLKSLTAGLDLLDAAAAPRQARSAAVSRSKQPSTGSTSTASQREKEEGPQARVAAGADRPWGKGEAPATPVTL